MPELLELFVDNVRQRRAEARDDRALVGEWLLLWIRASFERRVG